MSWKSAHPQLGSGWANVNKVASAVQLRFDVRGSKSLNETVRAALLDIPAITRMAAGDHGPAFPRTGKDCADARARLADIIRRAATPKKARRPTKIPKASKRKRLEGKKHRAEIKRGRARLD